MNDLDDLLLRWQDDAASKGDLAWIKRELAAPEGRACLVDYFFMSAVIVETLKAEAAETNVEAPSGASKVKAFSRWVWAAAAAVLILCVGIITAYQIVGNPIRTLARLHATDSGSILVRDGREQTAEAGMTLRMGDVIQTGTGGSATIRYEGEDSRIEMGSDTRVSLNPTATSVQNGEKAIDVSVGSIQAIIARQAPGASVNFTTPHAQVAVLGTHLRLVAAEHLTRLEVEEGTVQATRISDRASIKVFGGQRALFRESRDPEVRSIRVTKGLLALYLFEEGGGNLTHDVSGIGVPAHWRLGRESGWQWVSGGLRILSYKEVDFSAMPVKVRNMVNQTQEITLELWVEWEVAPNAKLVHLLGTRAKDGKGMVYANGTRVASGSVAGNFDLWFSRFKSHLATQRTEAQAPCDILRLMAVYDRALSPEEIALNYAAGAD